MRWLTSADEVREQLSKFGNKLKLLVKSYETTHSVLELYIQTRDGQRSRMLCQLVDDVVFRSGFAEGRPQVTRVGERIEIRLSDTSFTTERVCFPDWPAQPK